ncbi:MAG: MlaD family protein [Candidatus Binataceae bacterium]
MAKRVSSAAIGGFVAASFALILVAIVVVGAGKMFQRPVRFVCMFQGSINGLRLGAPVKFRGVQIGTVEEIRILLTPSEGIEKADLREFRIPVIIGVDRSMLQQYGASGAALSEQGFESMIARGLRAQLATESLLTGLLYVDLDLHPNTPLNLALVPNSGSLREIPTIPTTLEAIQKQVTEAIAKLDALDLKALVVSATSAAQNIAQLAGSPDLKATIAGLKETVPSLNQTLAATRVTLGDLKEKLIPLAEGLQTNSVQANITMKETTQTLADLRSILEPDSPLSVHLNEALDQLAVTTESVGELTDYLQRNPAALVRGKYVPEKDGANR